MTRKGTWSIPEHLSPAGTSFCTRSILHLWVEECSKAVFHESPWSLVLNVTYVSIYTKRRVSSSGKWRSWPGRSRSHLSSSVRIRDRGSMTALVFGDLVKVFKQTDQMMLWLSKGRRQSKHLNVGSSSAGLWLVSRCFCHRMKLLSEPLWRHSICPMSIFLFC